MKVTWNKEDLSEHDASILPDTKLLKVVSKNNAHKAAITLAKALSEDSIFKTDWPGLSEGEGVSKEESFHHNPNIISPNPGLKVRSSS